MPGHFSQILGDSAEEDFYALALTMGYNVLRRRNLQPGIDFIAEFRGRVFENASLLKPAYAPLGLTAFSVKAGGFEPTDVQELISYVSRCQQSTDSFLKQVQGGVLVSNSVKTAGQLDEMRSRGIYCWDTKRLIFYSVKSKKVAANSELGPVVEHSLNPQLNGSFIFTIHGMQPTEIDAIGDVFIDDHTLSLQGDHLTGILDSIRDTVVAPTAQNTSRRVRLRLSIHSIGPIQRTVVLDVYDLYRKQTPDYLVLYPGTDLMLQSYATGPWTAIFRV